MKKIPNELRSQKRNASRSLPVKKFLPHNFQTFQSGLGPWAFNNVVVSFKININAQQKICKRAITKI
jgi:hypothetical protein